MTPEQLIHFQTFLLLALNAAGEVGMPESTILPRARLEAFRDLTGPQLSVELRSMADRGWVVSYQAALGTARWKITGLGKSVLQEANLA